MPEIMTGCGTLAEHITFSNAMKKLGVSRSHMKRIVRDRNLQTFRLSERVMLLRLDEVKALLEGGTTAVTKTA